MIAGEWDDAIAELEASLALAEEIGDAYSRGYANGVLSLISFPPAAMLARSASMRSSLT